MFNPWVENPKLLSFCTITYLLFTRFYLSLLINLYLTSILLLMPINRPREIISKKSKAMVAISTVELLAYINPRRLGENKLPINNIDIMMRDAVPIT